MAFTRNSSPKSMTSANKRLDSLGTLKVVAAVKNKTIVIEYHVM